jgi:hypothetical protein
MHLLLWGRALYLSLSVHLLLVRLHWTLHLLLLLRRMAHLPSALRLRHHRRLLLLLAILLLHWLSRHTILLRLAVVLHLLLLSIDVVRNAVLLRHHRHRRADRDARQ